MIAEIAQIADAAAQRKTFRRDGMGYLWDVTEHNVEMRADYITARSEEIHAEITVTLNRRHLHLARFNLTSTSSRASLAKALNAVTERLEIPWPRLVEQFSVGVIRKEREGEPTQYAQRADRRPVRYMVDHLVIAGKTNMLFAPGGAGKGYLSVGVCCAVAMSKQIGDLGVGQGRPFYLDWEDDFETFQERLNRVASGMHADVPRVPYRRMRGLATEKINEIARALDADGATFAVLDSFSAAGGTTSERTSWDTVAHRLFDALDLVPNMTWLIIDHVAGDKMSDPAGKAFGSIQKMNRVRNAWEMRSDQEPGSNTVHMRLFDAKWNHTGKRKPMGMRMEFDAEGAAFYSEDPASTGQAPPVSLGLKMQVQLSAGPMSTADLARATKTSDATVRAEISRSHGRFRRDDNGLIYLSREQEPERDLDEPEKDLPW